VNKKSFLFVANWKMDGTGKQAMQYITEHGAAMVRLIEQTGNQIVVCPPFPLLGPVCELTRGTQIHVGAQTCSVFASGAYTGEVSAELLAELGCRYCIVGHSERRRYCHETDDDIARKVRMCLLAGIQPIMCVGETDDALDVSRTANVLEKQLEPLPDYLLDLGPAALKSFWIAYEPVWAIGTGKVADPAYVSQVYEVLGRMIARHLSQNYDVHYMYGGSLNEQNIQSMTHVHTNEGFLVGAASLDFQKFKDMISLSV
jgi:triosephosphate isomerase